MLPRRQREKAGTRWSQRVSDDVETVMGLMGDERQSSTLGVFFAVIALGC